MQEDRKMRVVVVDAMCNKDIFCLRKDMGNEEEWVFYDRTDPEQDVERCSEADIILDNKVVFTRELFQQLPRLKFICVCATGYNVIDVEAAREYGVIVSNVPAYSTMSVAQSVFAHLLNITNRVADYARQNREGMWSQCQDFSYRNLPVNELDGKTFCVIGMGSIGLKVARIAAAFGMKVVAVSSKSKEVLPFGVTKMELEEALSCADVVSLHCPLTPHNKEMMNADRLGMMKPGGILVNTARGGLVDECAVAKALEAGRLSAYAADVLSKEPPSPDNVLLSAPNVYLTPHIAWATDEARKRLITVCIENVKTFIKGQPQNVVS